MTKTFVLPSLQDVVANAIDRAQELQRSVLVSVTQAVKAGDPLDFFHDGQNEFYHRFFWHIPAQDFSLVGLGETQIFDAGDNLTAIQRSWHRLLDKALIVNQAGTTAGPILTGGFAFDPTQTPGQVWNRFPARRLTLHEISLTSAGDRQWLTLNAIVGTDSDAESLVEDLMLKSRRWQRVSARADQPSDRPTQLRLQDVEAERWKMAVADVAGLIRAGHLEKAVLARELRAWAERPFEPALALRRLRQDYPGCYLFAVSQGEHCFLGASPERLARVEAGRVDTMCLAGSIARGITSESDEELGAQLLHSTKDRTEHAIVVRAITEGLTSLCRELEVPDSPTLMPMKNVQHLFTPITARLASSRTLLDLVESLHPTPAVGGYPRETALDIIRKYESFDRGWYAGPVGWIDAQDNGEFAVAIRSALLRGSEASLFAGCGIVGDSDPNSEYRESELKLKPMLSILKEAAD